MNGNAPLCHYIYLSHHQGDGSTITLSVLYHLLLSIIRRPDVADDEKDGTEHLSLGTEKWEKNPNSFVRLCGRIEVSAVSAVPRSASEIIGHTGEKVGGKLCKGFC